MHRPDELTQAEDMKHDRKDFFINYTGVDHEPAEWIARQLDDDGYTLVIQAWDFRPGGNFVLEMHRALTTCERSIAVLWPAYLAATFTQPEWAETFRKDPLGIGQMSNDFRDAPLPRRVTGGRLRGRKARK